MPDLHDERIKELEEQLDRTGKRLDAANKRIEGLEDLIIASPDIIWRFDVNAMPEETRTIGGQWLGLVYLKKRDLEIVRRTVRAGNPLAV